MKKPENFTEDPAEVAHRIQHLQDYHGLEILDCNVCGGMDLACPNCHGDPIMVVSNSSKCDRPDCPINPIVPKEWSKRNN